MVLLYGSLWNYQNIRVITTLGNYIRYYILLNYTVANISKAFIAKLHSDKCKQTFMAANMYRYFNIFCKSM